MDVSPLHKYWGDMSPLWGDMSPLWGDMSPLSHRDRRPWYLLLTLMLHA